MFMVKHMLILVVKHMQILIVECMLILIVEQKLIVEAMYMYILLYFKYNHSFQG